MKKKIKVGLVFGGRSSEHEVSLISGWNIYNGFDKDEFELCLIGIDKQGNWHFSKDENIWLNNYDIRKIKLNLKAKIVTAVKKKKEICLIDLENGKKLANVDVFFPITHGTYGEDGCLQGFFETIGAPYVGPGVLGSSVGMDKDIAKRLLRDAGIKQAKFYTLRKSLNDNELFINKIVKDLKFPIFVKPASQGSSVGVSKAGNKKELLNAIKEAFKFDSKVIAEEMIVGREIECAILGNENLIASELGEIVLSKGFYSYDAKYMDEDMAKPVVGIKISISLKKKIQSIALDVYKTLECKGMGRVDFFLTRDNDIYVNEINTIPGFTNISMYPKMMDASGVNYARLLDKLVRLAMKK